VIGIYRSNSAVHFLKPTPAEMHLPHRKSRFKRRREITRARARGLEPLPWNYPLSVCGRTVCRFAIFSPFPQFFVAVSFTFAQSPARHSLFFAVLSHLPERPAIVRERIYDPLGQRKREMVGSIELGSIDVGRR